MTMPPFAPLVIPLPAGKKRKLNLAEQLALFRQSMGTPPVPVVMHEAGFAQTPLDPIAPSGGAEGTPAIAPSFIAPPLTPITPITAPPVAPSDSEAYPYLPMPGSPSLPVRPTRNRRGEALQSGAGALGAIAGLLLSGNKRAIPGAVSNYLRGNQAGQGQIAQDAEQQYEEDTRRAAQENAYQRQSVGDANATIDRRYRMDRATAAEKATQSYRDQQIAIARERIQQSGENADDKARNAFASNLSKQLAQISAQDPTAQNAALKTLRAQAERLGIAFDIPIPGEPTGQYREMPTQDGKGTKRYPILNPPLDLTPQDINRMALSAQTKMRTEYIPKAYNLGVKKVENQAAQAAAADADRDANRNLNERKFMLTQKTTAERMNIANQKLTAYLSGNGGSGGGRGAGAAKDPTSKITSLRRFITSTMKSRASLSNPNVKTLAGETINPGSKEARAAAINDMTDQIQAARLMIDDLRGGTAAPSDAGIVAPSRIGRGALSKLPAPPGMIQRDSPETQRRLSGTYGMPEAKGGTGVTQHHSAAQPRTGTGKFNGPPAPAPAPKPSRRQRQAQKAQPGARVTAPPSTGTGTPSSSRPRYKTRAQVDAMTPSQKAAYLRSIL